MPAQIVGWCDECKQWVQVEPAWLCHNGHPYASVRNHYYPRTGQAVWAPWVPEKVTAVAAPGYGQTPGTKEALLLQLALAIVAQPGFAVTLGEDCDLLAHMEDRFGSYRGWCDFKLTADEQQRCVHIREWDHFLELPDLRFHIVRAGEYWGWQRDMGPHSRTWINDPVGVHNFPLFWHHGDTELIAGQVAAAAGWAMSVDERRSPTDGWS